MDKVEFAMTVENGMSGKNVVAAGVPCGVCGYNLGWRPREGVCPECGEGVEKSVGEGTVDELGARARGLGAAAFGMGLSLVLIALLWLLLGAYHATSRRWVMHLGGFVVEEFPWSFAFSASSLLSLVFFMGMFLLLRPSWISGKLRVFSYISMAFVGGGLFVLHFFARSDRPQPLPIRASVILHDATLACTAIAGFALAVSMGRVFMMHCRRMKCRLLGVIWLINGLLLGVAILVAIVGHQFAQFGMITPTASLYAAGAGGFCGLATIRLLIAAMAAFERHVPLRPRVSGLIAGGNVATFLPCVVCAHDLRMRHVKDVCTECGTAVRESLDRSEVRWGAEHLNRYAAACRLMALWGASSAAYTLFLVGLAIMAGMLRWSGPGEVPVTIMCAALAVAGFAHVPGFWRLTRAPRGMPVGIHGWIIRFGSFAIAVIAALPVATLLIQLLSRGPMGMPRWVSALSQMALLCFPVLLLICAGTAFAFGIYHARRCRNVGMYSLGTWHLWTSWVVAAGAAIFGLTAGTVLAREYFSLSWIPYSEWVLVMSMLVGFGIGSLGYIGEAVLLFVTARRFRRLAAEISGVTPDRQLSVAEGTLGPSVAQAPMP